MPVKLLRTRRPNLKRTEAGVFYIHAKVNGQLVRGSLETTIESVALERLNRRLTTARNAVPRNADGDKISIGDAVGLFVQRHAASADLSPKTVARHASMAGTIQALPSSSLVVSRLTNVSMNQLLAELGDKSSGYTGGLIWMLNRTLKMCHEEGLLQRDPEGWLKRPRYVPSKPVLPNVSLVSAAIDQMLTAKENALEAWRLAKFLALSGARIGEATALEWQGVDLERGIVRFEVTKGASKRSEPRVVPMSQELREHLEKIKADTESLSGRVFSCGSVLRSLAAACKKAGCPRIKQHTLRHFFATRAIESGVDIPTVSRWLGHQDGGVLLMKTYGHLRDEHSREAAKRVRVF
jgi:site-specific recombinase XerD